MLDRRWLSVVTREPFSTHRGACSSDIQRSPDAAAKLALSSLPTMPREFKQRCVDPRT